MADAETMKKLRKKRRKSNQCTRCGKKVEDKEKIFVQIAESI